MADEIIAEYAIHEVIANNLFGGFVYLFSINTFH
jgi:hypothetical protein